MTIEGRPSAPLRHEWKHRLNRQDDLVLAGRLRRLFPHDRHAGPDGAYRVCSLYFDTPDDRALRQKLDGVDRREKFRLRYYGTDTTFLRLEKKYKRGGLCGKASARLTLEQVRALLEGESDFLPGTGQPLLMEFYGKLRSQLLAPRTVVTYDREAFTYGPGNVRVTIDRNLRGSLGPQGFLDPGRLQVPMYQGFSVLEVKYDAFLPELVAMAVQVPNRQAAACSKYAICRQYD